VRKIISILLALGVILGLTVAAVPTAAQTCTIPVVALVPPFCASDSDTYIIGPFTLPVTLIAPNDKLAVDFPTGTGLTAVVAANVLVNGIAVTSVTKSGTHIEFAIPVAGGDIISPTPITLTIGGVVNPATAGSKTLNVSYQLVCCAPVPVGCSTYTVVPALHTLGFHVDFDKSYTGIAEDFVPPFKACGQNNTGSYNATVGWMNIFDLILRADTPGCNPPCGNATMWFSLTKCPAGEVVTFHFDTLGTTLMYTLTAANVGTNYSLPNVIMPPPTPDKVWENRLHFSSPGDYELSFYLQCPAVPCLAGSQIVAQKSIPFKAYQWKDSAKITLDEKWNLISLPLVPFNTSITELLKSLDPEALDKDGVDDLQAIWYYQWNAAGTAAEWKSWEGTLTTMESGKAYWARMTYPITASPAYNWWVFGTAKNMPPSMPLAYDMAKGWNMFGFTRLATDTVVNYLWNFGGAGELAYPLMYGWFNSGTAATSDWDLIDPTLDSFVVGQGYWGYFPFGGTIVP
jgi:hypothetical protein